SFPFTRSVRANCRGTARRARLKGANFAVPNRARRAVPLRTGETCRSLLFERRDTLVSVFGGRSEATGDRFEGHRDILAQAAVDRLFGELDGDRGVGGDLVGDGACPGRELVAGNDFVDEAPAFGSGGLDAGTREDELLGAADADQSGEAFGAAPTGEGA